MQMKDPTFMQRTEKKMTVVSAMMASPVPEGESKEKYFNENYERLAPTQYSMVLGAQAEKPLPTLRESLEHPAFP
jgi:hypothetical protein